MRHRVYVRQQPFQQTEPVGTPTATSSRKRVDKVQLMLNADTLTRSDLEGQIWFKAADGTPTLVVDCPHYNVVVRRSVQDNGRDVTV